MENFPKYYTLLFNAVTDAIEDIDQKTSAPPGHGL